MGWQARLQQELVARLPDRATCNVAGSTQHPEQVDGWSDLDLHIHLPDAAETVDLLAGLAVWAATETRDADAQVVRAVLVDGRRIDLVVTGGRVGLPERSVDNEIRMLAVLAVTKLGRGDRLIGLHLTLELMRACLVQAMLLRDRALGTTVHRTGSDLDALTGEVLAVMQSPLVVRPRPNVVEQVVGLYARWRHQLESDYLPDWSGLDAVIARGLNG